MGFLWVISRFFLGYRYFILYRPRLLGHPYALPPHMIEQRHVPGRGEGVTFVTLGGGFWEVLSPLLCVLLARQLQS